MGGGRGRSDQVWRIWMGDQRGKVIKGVGGSREIKKKRLMGNKRERERERETDKEKQK